METLPDSIMFSPSLARPKGKVTGTGEVRDKEGNLKGVIHFEGSTELTEIELRQRLHLEPISEQTREVK